jgi:hypothetical protein
MKRRTLAELMAGDPRTLGFAGGASGTDGAARLDRAVANVQMGIERAELRPDVSTDVRARFEMVRTTFTYAVFAYELFSVAEAYARLLYEMALGERFVGLRDRRVALVHRDSGQRVELEVATFGDLWRALHEERYRHWMLDKTHAGWFVEGHARFLGSLPDLLNWAHGAGLLQAWLSFEWSRVGAGVRYGAMATFGDKRVIPDAYETWDERRRRRWWAGFHDDWEMDRIRHLAIGRHLVAHPEGGGLHGPATFAVHDLARFINSLWSGTPRRN